MTTTDDLSAAITAAANALADAVQHALVAAGQRGVHERATLLLTLTRIRTTLVTATAPRRRGMGAPLPSVAAEPASVISATADPRMPRFRPPSRRDT